VRVPAARRGVEEGIEGRAVEPKLGDRCASAEDGAATGEVMVGDGEGAEADGDERLAEHDADDVFFHTQSGEAGLEDSP
jgi:hypothetical protein